MKILKRYLLILILLLLTACGITDYEYNLINGYIVYSAYASNATIILESTDGVDDVLKLAWNERYIVIESESFGNIYQYWIIDALERRRYGPFVNYTDFQNSRKNFGIDDLILKDAKSYFPDAEFVRSTNYNLELIYGYEILYGGNPGYFRVSNYDNNGNNLVDVDGIAWDSQYIFLRTYYDNKNYYRIIDTKNGMIYGQYLDYENFKRQLSMLGVEDINFLSPSYYLENIEYNQKGERNLDILGDYFLSTKDDTKYELANKRLCGEKTINASISIPSRVKRLAWNDRYIIAEQQPEDAEMFLDISYWILDTVERKRYGPYDLKTFLEKKKLYHLEDLKLKSVDSYR